MSRAPTGGDSDSDEEWETARREHKQQVQPDDGHLSPATSVTSATFSEREAPEHEERPARSPLRLRTVPSSPHYRLSSEDEDDDTDVAVGGRVFGERLEQRAQHLVEVVGVAQMPVTIR